MKQQTLFAAPKKKAGRVPKKEKSISQKRDEYEVANVECARIVLADIEKYGGDQSLMVQASRLTLKRVLGEEIEEVG